MEQEADYSDEEDDYDPYDEEPPEYDVKARVRQLNEELAADPAPLDDERHRSIKFKDNLVDLVAPPPDYPSDEEGEEGAPSSTPPAGRAVSRAGGADGNVADLNLSQMNLNGDGGGGGDSPRGQVTREVGSDAVDTSGERTVQASGDGSRVGGRPPLPQQPPVVTADTDSAKPEDNLVLVQRGKTFELISASDLTAEERDIFLPPEPEEVVETKPARSPRDSSFQPKPPRNPRPSTAMAGQSRRPATYSARRRAQSATPTRKSNHGGVQLNDSYCSPYAQAEELKKLGERQKKQKDQRERKEKEISKMENAQKTRENEKAFVAWLSNKRRSGAWRREDSDDEITVLNKEIRASTDDESSQKGKNEAAFAEWLRVKRDQQRRERQVEERRQEEEEQGWYDRPRQECDKAFRQYVFQEWLKKKNLDTKKAKKQEISRQRVNRLLIRRTHKAMQLVRAFRQSQSFRYVDYYGYRF